MTNFQQLDVTCSDIYSIPTRGKGRTWRDAQHDARYWSCPLNRNSVTTQSCITILGTFVEEQQETRILSLNDLLIDTSRPSKGERSAAAYEHQKVLTLDDLSAIY